MSFGIKTHCESCGATVLGIVEALKKIDGRYLCSACVAKSNNPNSLRYAGFGPRLGSLLLDAVIMAPLSALVFWADGHYRLFMAYYLIPSTLFGLFYGVYLVRRFGGTPGKLILGIRIRKTDGEPVGYREAFLRYFPDALLGLLMSITLLFSLFRMSDVEYQSLAFMERAKRMVELAPAWYKPLQIGQTVWVWGELIVLLTNRKRRALHDFIAGTVVVHETPKPAASPAVTNPAAESPPSSPAGTSDT